MKKWITGGLCTLILTGLTACSPVMSEETPGNNADDASAHVFGMTQEQRLEDFTYFEQELQNSYLCWGILERKGINYESILKEYREMTATENSDFQLYVAVNSALYRLGGEGHLSLLQPEWYDEFLTGYAEIPDRTKWYTALNNPVSQKNYPILLKVLNEMNEGEDSQTYDSEGQAVTENVTTLIIEEGKTAYLKIDSFESPNNADQNKIAVFLDQTRSYENLIIDITQNSGGSDNYWMDFIVAPLAKETLSNTNYALVKNSENTAKYIEEAFSAEELHPIGELPALPRLEPRDRELATHYIENTLTVQPSGSGFDGKVWLLVSNQVYSAAEAFTVFCKDTGFATIVGTETGGDGIGIDPVYFMLPNSGLLIRYSPLFGLNPDGSSNEEYGSTPDIISPEGETALVTVLRAIRAAAE